MIWGPHPIGTLRVSVTDSILGILRIITIELGGNLGTLTKHGVTLGPHAKIVVSTTI